MKNPKRPTREQKKQMIQVGLNPNHWLVFKNLPEELHLVHRETNTTRVLFI